MSVEPAPTWPAGAVLPDYGGGGLFGLMTNIAAYLDGGAFVPPGVASPAASPSDERVLVFLLIDGLGDEFLQRYGRGSELLARRQNRITSVFPSTTVSAVTTTLTALSPARHGLTGWFTYDARFGGIIAPLPMVVRGAGPIDAVLAPRRLFPYASLFQKRVRPSIIVTPSHLADSRFSRRHGRGAVTMPFRGLADMVEVIDVACRQLEGGKGGLVHAYYPVFDALSHEHGSDSAVAQETFWRIDGAFARLCARFEPRNVDIVVTADHGFIDSPPERQIHLEDHPDLRDMLATPLFGERRAALCNVRPGAEPEFEAAAGCLLAGRAVVRRSHDLVEQGLFGPGRAHRRLHERLGSHALLMEEGWTLIDTLADEKPHYMLGVHGGLSAREMWVPLIHAEFGTRGS
ncbi:MAG TPA: alkaline phosphatase family protein [Rhodocyclaceae bacterium]|nr:alkaline phosphatase family protein [Rhodocyclaceae bacterium]